MFKLYVTVFVTILTSSVIANQDDVLEWLDYTGDIPEDAIPVGKNANGEHVFIGLAHVSDDKGEAYLPASIRTGYPYVNVTLNQKPYTVYENVKILCGKNDYLTKVRWVNTDETNFMELFDHDDYHPVRAGWEASEFEGRKYNTSVYIGTGVIYSMGGTFAGKVYTSYPSPSKNKQLLIDTFAVEQTYFHPFNVLIYYLE